MISTIIKTTDVPEFNFNTTDLIAEEPAKNKRIEKTNKRIVQSGTTLHSWIKNLNRTNCKFSKSFNFYLFSKSIQLKLNRLY